MGKGRGKGGECELRKVEHVSFNLFIIILKI